MLLRSQKPNMSSSNPAASEPAPQQDDLDSNHDSFLLEAAPENASKYSTASSVVHIIIVSGILVLTLVLFVSLLGVSLPFSIQFRNGALSVTAPSQHLFECDKCEYTVAETIPDQLVVPKAFADTSETWIQIINSAKSRLRILAFYLELWNEVETYGDKGNKVLDAIIKRASEIEVQLVIYKHTASFPDEPDMTKLREAGVEVVEIDWEQAFGGVLHTKMILADSKMFYIGSANMDWKSLNQVKELGIKVECECMASDMERLFEKYYYLGTTLNSSFVDFTGWPQHTYTALSAATPMQVPFNQDKGKAFISAAPKLMAAPGRTNDLDALVGVIKNSHEHVYIEVMDYLPFAYYGTPHGWWGEIDNALRDAFARGVNVKLLIGKWEHSPEVQENALKSLLSFGNDFCNRTEYHGYKWCESTLEVRYYTVPDPHGYKKYPFTRVNHAKFMVTDQQSFITTSNWGKDYYYKTAGMSLVLTHDNVRKNLEEVFLRDWNSEYASDVV